MPYLAHCCHAQLAVRQPAHQLMHCTKSRRHAEVGLCLECVCDRVRNAVGDASPLSATMPLAAAGRVVLASVDGIDRVANAWLPRVLPPAHALPHRWSLRVSARVMAIYITLCRPHAAPPYHTQAGRSACWRFGTCTSALRWAGEGRSKQQWALAWPLFLQVNGAAPCRSQQTAFATILRRLYV